MRVIVYVEGRSDKAVMEELLAPLLARKLDTGVHIDFIPVVSGDRKATLLTKIPIKAAEIIIGDPDATVIAMPDLYPPNKGFDHSTFDEMQRGMMERFANTLRHRRVDDRRLFDQFKVFCFKYDLEVLLLSNESALQSHLGVTRFKRTWCTPAEDQNHDHPPKMVVRELFQKHGKSYSETLDAPRILRKCNYQETADQCPQCFKPFVEFLTSL